MNNIYQPIKAKIEKVIQETPNIKRFVLKTSEPFSFSTGQFVEMTVPDVGEAPFTPSSNPADKECFDVTVMKVGLVTEKLHQMKEGDTVGVRGPFGMGYPLDKFAGKEVLILGGGVGMAPLRSLLLALLNEPDRFKRVVLCYGAKTPDDVVYKQCFPEWGKQTQLEIKRSIDRPAPDWNEEVCLAPALLEKVKVDQKNCVVVVCGPPIMMKFGTIKILELGYKPEQIYLSMEKNMSCGLGKCGHCNVGPYFACKDGPVFTYDKIKDFPGIWD